MTCMAELLLESASESMESEYFFKLSSLGALSKAGVITGSCLWCSCSISRVDVRVEEVAERVVALLRVMMSEVTPLATKTLLFFALVAEIA
ncbi:hypothetical protein ACFX16_028197 [Malus domestica]